MNQESNRAGRGSRQEEPIGRSSERSSEELSGTGYLLIRATTAKGAIPLEGVRVMVRNRLPEFTEGRGDVILSTVTDRSGNTERLALPTPPRVESEHPGGHKPYATYDVDLSADGYYQHRYSAVPVFDGITAVQQADLIPLPENGIPDGATSDGTLYFRTEESQAPLN